MTKQESQAVFTAITPLYTFADTTDKAGQWHRTWQALWQQALRAIAALEDKPEPKEEKPKP